IGLGIGGPPCQCCDQGRSRRQNEVDAMLNQDIVREATRLTRAGQLLEATALLQSMLRGETAPAASRSSARTAPARLEPPTIDAGPLGVAEGDPRPAATAAAPKAARKQASAALARKWSVPRAGLGLRGPILRAPATREIVPEGTSFIEGSFANAAGRRAYK